MFSKSVILIFLFRSGLLIQGQVSDKFFRKDYTFFEETQSFYKIHTLQKTWENAKYYCEVEGASLFYPEDDDEAFAVISHWNKTQPFLPWLYIGVAAWNVKEIFETIDGRQVSDVYDNWGYGEPNNAGGNEGCVLIRKDGTLNDDECSKSHAFICKKPLSTLQWDNLCSTPYPGFKYSPVQERCYKFHSTPKNWTEAYRICYAEQSYLAVINSDEEAKFLINIAAEAATPIIGSDLTMKMHLGFRKRNNKEWTTIKGIPIDQSGYSKWGDGQTDGKYIEDCGAMFYNAQLIDINCSQNAAFICEHEVPLKSENIQFRFSSK